MTEIVKKTRTHVVFTLSAPAGRRGRGGLGGTNSITLYQTEWINLKHSLDIFWGQNNALNLKETLSYYRLASSSGGLFGTSGFSTAISIITYDLESAYIWDNNKSEDHTLPRLFSYLTASFWCIIYRWTNLSLRVDLWLQSSHTVRLSRLSLGIWL